MKPAISLLMINRNRGRYIGAAISSVLKQTDPDWELIILDDASSDSSIDTIKSFLADERIKFFQNASHLGIGLSRRRSVEAAGADILGIIDSDDCLEPEAVETMVRAHQESEAGLIYSQLIVCDESLSPVEIGSNGPIPSSSCNLLLNRISHFATFKKSAYERTAGYDPRLNLAEDKDIFYKLEEVAETLFVDRVLYRYRRHRDSASSFGWPRWHALIVHYAVRLKAYRRRRSSASKKKVDFRSLLPSRWVINRVKLFLDRIYFPILLPAALSKFHRLSQGATDTGDLWRFADSFKSGPALRGLNLNIRPAQVEKEITDLMKIVNHLKPQNILEIGTATGGTLFFWTRLAAPTATIISLDLPFGRFGGGYLSARKKLLETFPAPGQKLELVQADSHRRETKEKIMRILAGKSLDFLFIDGDHSYEGARQDWQDYGSLVRPGGLIALHDIAKNIIEPDSQVDRLWTELKARYQTEELIADPDQGWAGIGIIYK